MNVPSNKQGVLDAYTTLNAGDAAGFLARMADDVEVTYFGNHLQLKDGKIITIREYMDTGLTKDIFG